MKNLGSIIGGTALAGIGAGMGAGYATLFALSPIGGAIIGGIAILGLVAGVATSTDDDE